MVTASRSSRRLIPLLLAATMAGCAAVEVPGATRADSALKDDVTDALKQWELGYGCSTLWLTVVDTQLVSPFDGHSTKEKWLVQSCNGEIHAYEVSFMPAPGGGTNLGIRKWPE
jgi:hypothetical protein